MNELENNKLIAEFMGITPNEAGVYHVSKHKGYSLENLQYHTSWDWLMPVIENIDHLQYESVKSIEKALSTRHLGDTYQAVVEFINLQPSKFLCGSCGEPCNEYIYNEETDVDECNDCKKLNQ